MSYNPYTNTNHNNDGISMRKFFAGLLITAGSFGVLGSAGTSDARDAIDYENERVGYEKYSTDDLASEKTTKALAWGGIAAIAGGALLLAGGRKENER
ncbi:MAG: LPXTG cell wall anchor domain-containing protein [Alphaproteobacteria bacterium]|nr:LPXTG cell wall anchor domain-containing protein [Alphaproteobacteria bacterium]